MAISISKKSTATQSCSVSTQYFYYHSIFDFYRKPGTIRIIDEYYGFDIGLLLAQKAAERICKKADDVK